MKDTTISTSRAPWGIRRMQPLRNGAATLRYAGLDAESQTGRWIGKNGETVPMEMGKHGSSVNTYPPTQVSKDGKMDPDSGHDAEQD